MTLYEMTEGPAEARRAFNALVDAVRGLQRLSADPPLSVDRSGGVPKLRVASWPPPSIRLGVTEEEIASGGSGSVLIWRAGSSTFEATSESVHVDNFFSIAIPSSRRVMLAQGLDDGRWYVIAEDCGDTE
jgi:hypothetical protein